MVTEPPPVHDRSPGHTDVRGLTARYVEAGVMAAAVADEASLLDQIRALVADLARGKAPAPVYPATVRVAVNPTVARNLNLSDEAIERARAIPSRH